jgi:hypothetical protein
MHVFFYTYDKTEPCLDGVVKCREIGCGVDVQLNANSTDKDGGLTVGFGSLSAYRVRRDLNLTGVSSALNRLLQTHIETHSTHQAARNARIRFKRTKVFVRLR